MQSEIIEELYQEIKHGDNEHQQWLRHKLYQFFSTRTPQAEQAGWIDVKNPPPYDTPVFAAYKDGDWGIFRRVYEDEGWYWEKLDNYGIYHQNQKLNDWEGDDYEGLKYWLPIDALPKPPAR